DVVVHRAQHVYRDALFLHDRDAALDEALRVAALRGALQRAVDEQRPRGAEWPRQRPAGARLGRRRPASQLVVSLSYECPGLTLVPAAAAPAWLAPAIRPARSPAR